MLTSPSNSRSNGINRNHQIAGSVNWKIDSTTTLSFRPNLSFRTNDGDGFNASSTTDNFKGLVSRNQTNNFSNGNSRQYTHSLYLNHYSRKKKGRSYTLSSNFSYNDNYGDYYNEGVYTFYKAGLGTDSLLYQLQDRGAASVRGGLSFNFTEPLSKNISLVLSHRADYARQENSLDYYNREPVTGNIRCTTKRFRAV